MSSHSLVDQSSNGSLALQADSLPSGLFSGSKNGEAVAGARNIDKEQ